MILSRSEKIKLNQGAPRFFLDRINSQFRLTVEFVCKTHKSYSSPSTLNPCQSRETIELYIRKDIVHKSMA